MNAFWFIIWMTTCMTRACLQAPIGNVYGNIQHLSECPDFKYDIRFGPTNNGLGVLFKVVNMGTAISETKLMDKWAASKRTQVSAILCIKLLPLLENALKLNFKALYETENLDPLQGPTHTLTPSSIHTQNRPQNYGWIYHLLSSLAGYSPKLTATLKNRGLATLGFQKKFHAHQLKPTQAKASFQKVNLPPAKIGMLFHVHLSVTEFWPHIYSLSPAQSSYQTSQIRPNTKMGGACNAERSTL